MDRTGSAYEEFQFAGQQTDPAGRQYLRARYSDPATGRFLSRDPKDGWSYSYAGDNPATGTDPTGRDTLLHNPCIRGRTDGTFAYTLEEAESGTGSVNDAMYAAAVTDPTAARVAAAEAVGASIDVSNSTQIAAAKEGESQGLTPRESRMESENAGCFTLSAESLGKGRVYVHVQMALHEGAGGITGWHIGIQWLNEKSGRRGYITLYNDWPQLPSQEKSDGEHKFVGEGPVSFSLDSDNRYRVDDYFEPGSFVSASVTIRVDR
ncbi:MAG TPA: RHS repeat-associated core domain-containing protein [Dehalococcoidia bacterium]|nr:RHS repeat-associated core domain-containing protein [Dehalococcoidia bacterium]